MNRNGLAARAPSAPLDRIDLRSDQLELGFDAAITSTHSQAGGAIRRALLADGWIVYRLERVRRRTLAIYVDRHGVRARAPLSMPVVEIEAFLSQKSRWISRRLRDSAQHASPGFSWRAGARFPILGNEIELAPVPGERFGRLHDGRLEIGLEQPGDPAQLRARTLDWIRTESSTLFAERLGIYAQRLGVPMPKLRLSNARGQWGSCHSDGRVLLTWRLFHTPLPLIDYVVAHEIAHLKELNHSHRFWKIVERLYPDYLAARNELRLLGRRLPDLEAAR